MQDGYVLHIGAVNGSLKVGDKVICTIDTVRSWPSYNMITCNRDVLQYHATFCEPSQQNNKQCISVCNVIACFSVEFVDK